MQSDKIATWASTKFEGLTRAELREAAEVLGLTFGPNVGEATMRTRLCEHVGTLPNEAPVAVVAPKPQRIGPFDPKPNLTASGEWGGRRHHVTIFPQGPESENSSKYVRLFHECIPRDYPYNVQVNLPEPLYDSLRNAQKGVLTPREVKADDGGLLRIEHIESKLFRFPHQYHGIVPGTEDLPGSLLEYWQRQAAKTSNFEGLSRRTLMAIRTDLFGPVGRDFYKDMTDQDILYDILIFLGIDELAEVA